VRRVGILVGRTENTQVIPSYIGVFRDGLSKLGWVEGRNLRIDARFSGEDADRARRAGGAGEPRAPRNRDD
jgi:putative ABC transport system substrate-binding protein